MYEEMEEMADFKGRFENGAGLKGGSKGAGLRGRWK